MRAAIYARVSTTHGQDPRMQLREVHEFCQRREWTVIGEFVDVGVSGSKEKRPELDRLLADCIPVPVCWFPWIVLGRHTHPRGPRMASACRLQWLRIALSARCTGA
jgi:hypothetical protein